MTQLKIVNSDLGSARPQLLRETSVTLDTRTVDYPTQPALVSGSRSTVCLFSHMK